MSVVKLNQFAQSARPTAEVPGQQRDESLVCTGLRVEFGRIAVSATEPPNILTNLV